MVFWHVLGSESPFLNNYDTLHAAAARRVGQILRTSGFPGRTFTQERWANARSQISHVRESGTLVCRK